MAEDPNETARRAFGDLSPPLAPPSPPSIPSPPADGSPSTRYRVDDHALATWGTRAMAFALDWLLISVILMVASLIGSVVTSGDDDKVVTVVVYALGIPLGMLYAPLLMARRGDASGQTVGKQVMRIRVVRQDGRPVGFWNSVLRQVIGQQLLAGLTFYLWAIVDYLWPLRDDRSQALHDKIAGTVVIRVHGDETATTVEGPAMPGAAADWPRPSPRRVDGVPAGDWLPPRADS